MRTLLALLLLGAALAILPAGSAQTYSCGDVQLIFKNPDLQPKPDGFVHAQGQFFVQFQAIGADADKIKVFGFSFGPATHNFDQSMCAYPAWVTGAYFPNYRADRDPTDGFFIPVKTTLVPDGTYAAAVHAYDANNNELARFWALAIVDNCDTQPTAAQERCDGDAAQALSHDKTAPWPIILPGDGQALEGRKLTIEFGEQLSSLSVFINGRNVTEELVPWEGRLWDADYVPDYGPGGASGAVAPPCTQPYHTCVHYGPAYEWTVRDLTDQDVVRVEARDLAGNLAVKDIHIGSSVGSGAITAELPIIRVTADSTRAELAPGKSALFRFRLANDGNGEGHPFAEASVPEGFLYEWNPVHVVVPPGAVRDQELTVTAGMAPGTYTVNATFRYQAGAEKKAITTPLEIRVSGTPASTETTTGTDTKPAFAPPLPPVVLALAALAWRRVASRRK
jgi:hypothetical protein